MRTIPADPRLLLPRGWPERIRSAVLACVGIAAAMAVLLVDCLADDPTTGRVGNAAMMLVRHREPSLFAFTLRHRVTWTWVA